MLSFYDFYLLLENQTVIQKLKSFDKNDVQNAKVKAKEEVDRIFHFQINEKKKQELINWHALQLLLKTNGSLDHVKDYISSELNKINFNDSSLNFQKLEYESVKWHNELANNRSIGRVGRIGTPIITFPDNWKWVMLDRASCEIEGNSMGHCGNSGYRQGDVIYSLRDPKNIPYLTFVVNRGWIGESKGRFNKKPESRFHPYIVRLLLSDNIKGIEGGGYLPENNFELDDLSPELKKKVLTKNPYIDSTTKRYLEKYLDYDDNYIKNMSLEDALKIAKEENKEYYGNNYEIPKNREEEVKKYLIDDARSLIKKTAIGRFWESLYLKSTIAKNLIKNVVEEINKINNYEGLAYADKLKFLKYTKLNYPDVFEEIYKQIDREVRSTIISYFIATDVKFSDNKYYDLSERDLYQIYRHLSQANLPIPDRIQSMVDFDKEEVEFDKTAYYYNEILIEIIFKLTKGENLSEKEKTEFDQISLVSVDDFKKLVKKVSIPIENLQFHRNFLQLITDFNGLYVDDYDLEALHSIIESGVVSSEKFYDHARKIITNILGSSMYHKDNEIYRHRYSWYYLKAKEILNLLNDRYYSQKPK